jgi:hypothetical protein
MVWALMRLVMTSAVRLVLGQRVLRAYLGGQSATYQQIEKIKSWEAEKKN